MGQGSLKSDVIINSFKVCGVSLATDGSEDRLIHCQKPGEVAAEAASDIARLTSALQNSEMTPSQAWAPMKIMKRMRQTKYS